MQPIIENKKIELEKLCKELKVKKLYVFGSAASENFNPESDIDFLISFLDNISIEEYTNNYFLFHYKLREIFNKNIDLIN